jgi:hypothetical protein
VGNPVTGVKPSAGSSDPIVNPFGTLYDEHTGKCVEDRTYPVNDCDTSQSLEDEAQRKNAAIKAATGDAERQRLMLELARIEAQLAAREALGNDRLADAYIGRIEQSNLYDSLKDNPRAKTMLWLGIAGGLESGAYRKYSMSPKQYLESLVRGAENLRFAGRDSKGKPILFEVPKGVSRSDARVIPLNGPLTGLGIAGCMLFCTTAGQVVPMMGVSITLLTVTLNIGGGLLSKGVFRVSDDSDASAGANEANEVGSQTTAGTPNPNDPDQDDPCDPGHRKAAQKAKWSEHAGDRAAVRATSRQVTATLRDGVQFAQPDGRVIFALGGEAIVYDPVTKTIVTVLEDFSGNYFDRKINNADWNPC